MTHFSVRNFVSIPGLGTESFVPHSGFSARHNVPQDLERLVTAGVADSLTGELTHAVETAGGSY